MSEYRLDIVTDIHYFYSEVLQQKRQTSVNSYKFVQRFQGQLSLSMNHYLVRGQLSIH